MIDFSVWGGAAATTLAVISVILVMFGVIALMVGLPYVAGNLIGKHMIKVFFTAPEKRKIETVLIHKEKPKRLALGDDGELLLVDGE